ncbi:MAG: aminopeptidase P N-terminal domain-containing protein [Ignavibacteriales bacterium]|nr:aminopeptidase P N-terminal domain-containing protein [Ignavibacteriales bacterium]
MTSRSAAARLLVAWIIAISTLTAFGQSPDNTAEALRIKPEEYKQRRALLMAKMEPNSIAIFKAKDPANRSNDVNYLYRQESNFLYLTGCSEQRSYLLLCPEGIQIDSVTTVKEVFFVRPKTRSAAGESLGLDGAKSELGFAAVLPSTELLPFARKALAGKKILYYPPSMPDIVYDPLMEKRTIVSRELKADLQSTFPELEIKSLASSVAELRSVKSQTELELIQRAIDATIAAHVEAMKSSEPAMYEYELQAVIEYCFAKNGAEYQGFPSIVGSGPNSCILHYEANRRQMKDGDVVVMDLGAEYHGYSADVTRTIPVNGTFSPPQKEIYEIVLQAQTEATKEFKPGVLPIIPSQKAYDVIAEGLMKLGIIKDKQEARTYYMHGLSHHIGLDVHDPGPYGKPYVPGMILTNEPGIYIPAGSSCDKKYWNIGVRIEDDILITADGNRVLSAGAPKTVKQIEALMKRLGLGNMKIGVN